MIYILTHEFLDNRCSHGDKAGQELCYLCHQRAQKNVPIYFTEERRQRELEQDRLLQQYQQQKDTEAILKEQVWNLATWHNGLLVTATFLPKQKLVPLFSFIKTLFIFLWSTSDFVTAAFVHTCASGLKIIHLKLRCGGCQSTAGSPKLSWLEVNEIVSWRTCACVNTTATYFCYTFSASFFNGYT